MVGAVGRLIGMKKVVGCQVGIKLTENNLFQKLGDERQVGYRSVVF